jgi:hypothetical protein
LTTLAIDHGSSDAERYNADAELEQSPGWDFLSQGAASPSERFVALPTQVKHLFTHAD